MGIPFVIPPFIPPLLLVLVLIPGLSIVRNGKYMEIPDEYIYSDDELVRAYLRGLFLSSGSINDPKTSKYHLELLVDTLEYAEFISKLLNDNDLNSRVISREKKYMVYIKEAEKISDFLRIIKAYNAVMYYEDIRIYRDHKNMTNRLNNCEQANMDKIFFTASNQIKDIEKLKEYNMLDVIDDKRKIVIDYRIKYPELSLAELSEVISEETGNNISKSGLNHRFRKIKEMIANIENKDIIFAKPNVGESGKGIEKLYKKDYKIAADYEFMIRILKDKKVKGIYLHGSFGTGKTYIVSALLNELAKRGHKVAIVYYPEFLRALKESFNTTDEFKNKFNYIKKVELLLLDDIGAETVTEWSRDEILGPILQYRMENNLSTFITSNLNLEELEVHLSIVKNNTDKVKARRIIERIKQLTEPMEMISKNLRKWKGH